jgi:hypothetical protein
MNKISKVSQVDMVPTISLLFGLPIPKNSLGIPIDSILKDIYGSSCEFYEYALTTLNNMFSYRISSVIWCNYSSTNTIAKGK